MSNPNFVSELVLMAKAMEELPMVQADLRASQDHVKLLSESVMSLELRIIDLKNDLDTAHATIRKVEVERDHAERMFLETDDRLNAFRRLLGSFQTEAGALIAAAEPEATVQVATSPVQGHEPAVERQAEPITDLSTLLSEPIPAVLISGDPANIDSVSSGPQDGAESATNPIEAPPSTTDGTTTPTDATNASDSRVSVSWDPTPATETSSENASPASVQPDPKPWLTF